MDELTAAQRTQEIAARIIAPAAAKNDREASFPREAIRELGKAGLLGLTVAREHGGAGLGPRAFASTMSTIAEADGSVAMIYLMHVMGTACIAAAAPSASHAATLKRIAAGEHLTTLAFSEKGSRSHFWAPVSRATKHGAHAHINAYKSWVTSAGEADSYVVSTLAADGKSPTDSTLYLIDPKSSGVKTATPWDGLGLRANASSPVALEGVEVSDDNRLTEDGRGAGLLEVADGVVDEGREHVGRARQRDRTDLRRRARGDELGESEAPAGPRGGGAPQVARRRYLGIRFAPRRGASSRILRHHQVARSRSFADGPPGDQHAPLALAMLALAFARPIRRGGWRHADQARRARTAPGPLAHAREARVHPLEAEPERDVTRVQDRRPHLRDRRLYREVHGATLAEAHPIDASDDVRPDTQLPDRAAA